MSANGTRSPAVAGKFYPGNPNELAKMVAEALRYGAKRCGENVEVTGDDSPGGANDAARCRAILAPHAGYVFSGPCAGTAFAAAVGARQAKAAADAAQHGEAAEYGGELPTAPRRVILVGPAHYVPFSGVALPGYGEFATPLGSLPVDSEAVGRITGGAQAGDTVVADAAHRPEHSLEVMLPFVQLLWGEVPILPLLCGRVDEKSVERVLHEELGDDDMLVISSDLSHFHPASTAEKIDNELLQAVTAGDKQKAGKGEACGKIAVLAAMELASQRAWTPRLLEYAHSGHASGDMSSVVGYGAVAYYE